MNILYAQEAKDQDLPIMQWFMENLPPKPYCTNQLGFLLIRPKATALKNAYIQYNPITRAYWFVFDIDDSESRYWPDEHKLPTPNLEIRNPANNHQHVFYLIDPAVYTLRQARRKPLELAADVDRGLTDLLGADPGYGKLIAKNPLHTKWLVIVWHDRKWGLTELLDYLPRRRRQWKVKEEVGLGRNCTIFEKTRLYAYSEWRRLKFDDYFRLFEAVYAYAMEQNEGFITPMLQAEVKCIVRSVSKWTAKHITKAGFQQWCSQRGKVGNLKSQVVRKTKAAERAAEAKALYAGGKTQQQIAAILGISERQVRTLLLS